MWTRAELKDRAKVALSNAYWKLVLVGLIASVVGTGYSSSIDFTVSEEASPDIFSTLGAMLPAFFGIAFVGIIIGLLVAVFIINPLEVGTNRFFLKSLSEDTEIKELLYAFDHGYMNIVKEEHILE